MQCVCGVSLLYVSLAYANQHMDPRIWSTSTVNIIWKKSIVVKYAMCPFPAE